MRPRSRPIKLILLFALSFIALNAHVFAQNDSLNLSQRFVIWTGNFNSDAYTDTIVGVRFTNGNFMPKWIKWGKFFSDSTSKVTEIVYPNWKKLKGTYNIFRLDQDSLKDLMITCKGDTSTDTSQKKYASLSVVIFAQDCIDTLQSIVIENIKGFQTEPLSLELKNGEIYKSVQINKTNGTITCEVKPYYIAEAAKKKAEQKTLANSPNIKIYPNPAAQYTNLEINDIPAGTYTAEIRNSIGSLIDTKTLRLQSSSKILEQISFNGYASGSYFIKLSKDNETLGIYPFIIYK